MAKFSYHSYLKTVIKDVIKEEIAHRKEAVKYAKKKMRKNISIKGESLPGEYPGLLTGNLKKGIKYKMKTGVSGVSFVGSVSPHAHLLEFGHGDGKMYNKRPFVRRTLEEEKDEIKKILSETYF